jgi:glycosyltransferase involved in cell wall biosynthesis
VVPFVVELRMLIARVIARLELGGAQLGALRLSEALRSQGVESRVLAGTATPEGIALFEDAGIAVEAWPDADEDLQYACSGAFARWLRPRISGADLAHGHMFGGWWAVTEAAHEGLPVAASEHNALQWPSGERIREMRRALRRVDAFFAHGPATRATVRRLGLPSSRLHSGRSAVEQPSRHRVPAVLEDLLRPRVLFAGRLHREKGPDLLLDAIARLSPRPACVLLGMGPAEEALSGRARELGIEELVRLPGWQDEVGPWLAGADLVVVPSRYESWSQAAVTAMAHGVPVVATNVEGLPSTLAEGRGLLVPPEDPAALASAIDDALSGRRLPDLAAARRYAARYTAPNVAAHYLAVYRGLASRAQPAPALPEGSRRRRAAA